MLTDTELADCRALQAEGMPDVCTIRRPGGTRGAFDPATGTYDTVPYDPYYPATGDTGICRVQSAGDSLAAETVAADQQVTTHVCVVAVPYSVTDVQVGDIIKVTTSNDPRWAGREFKVGDIQGSSFVTARRLLCSDTLGSS